MGEDAEYGFIFVVTYDAGALVGHCGHVGTHSTMRSGRKLD